MLCCLRYRQIRENRYRKLVIGAAARYLTSDPPAGFPVYPGAYGDAITLMLAAYNITADKKYLERADKFGKDAVGIFFKDSPLPSASSMHDHYEAVTRGDTLVISLLKLWAATNRPELKLGLAYSDR